jgi:hypothetical protein
MKKLSLVMCLVALSTAGAQAATRLEVPITYMANAEAVEGTKRDCKIEEMLSSRIGPMLAKLYKMDKGTIDVGTDPANDKVLRVQITHVLGAGGGAWSGPKAITVLAELLDGGKVVYYTKINEWTTGGVFGGFKGTCDILERSANAITKDLNEWVQNPSTKVEEKPAPKGAPVPSAEAPKASAPTATATSASVPASTPSSAPTPAAEEKAQK